MKISTSILSIVIGFCAAACGSTAVVAPITPAPLTHPVTDDVVFINDSSWTATPHSMTLGHRTPVTAKAATSFTREAYISVSTSVSTAVASNE